MSNKLAVRLIVGLVAIAALFTAFQWFKEWSVDPSLTEKVESADMVAALLTTENGSRAVIFSADGEKSMSPDPGDLKEDRELSWSPLGNHVYLSSNREDEAFNVYRWQPLKNQLEKKSTGSRSESAPTFLYDGEAESVRQGLVTAGGTVLLYDPRLQVRRQLLPPSNQAMMNEDGGSIDAMTAVYEKIGSSFKSAYWNLDRSTVFATMRREGGEVFLLNPLSSPDGQLPRPSPIAAGDRIFLHASANGVAVASIQGFQFVDPANVEPEFLKDGKPNPPFRNYLMIASTGPTGEIRPAVLTASPDDSAAFGDVAVAPDGKSVAVVVGKKVKGEFKPEGLVLVPLTGAGPGQNLPLAGGEVSMPSWHPNGKKLVYLKRENGKRVIHIVNSDGTGEVRLSGDGEDYRSPQFSPLIKE